MRNCPFNYSTIDGLCQLCQFLCLLALGGPRILTNYLFDSQRENDRFDESLPHWGTHLPRNNFKQQFHRHLVSLCLFSVSEYLIVTQQAIHKSQWNGFQSISRLVTKSSGHAYCKGPVKHIYLKVIQFIFITLPQKKTVKLIIKRNILGF